MELLEDEYKLDDFSRYIRVRYDGRSYRILIDSLETFDDVDLFQEIHVGNAEILNFHLRTFNLYIYSRCKIPSHFATVYVEFEDWEFTCSLTSPIYVYCKGYVIYNYDDFREITVHSASILFRFVLGMLDVSSFNLVTIDCCSFDWSADLMQNVYNSCDSGDVRVVNYHGHYNFDMSKKRKHSLILSKGSAGPYLKIDADGMKYYVPYHGFSCLDLNKNTEINMYICSSMYGLKRTVFPLDIKRVVLSKDNCEWSLIDVRLAVELKDFCVLNNIEFDYGYILSYGLIMQLPIPRDLIFNHVFGFMGICVNSNYSSLRQ